MFLKNLIPLWIHFQNLIWFLMKYLQIQRLLRH